MIMTTKIITCLECEQETKIKDKFDEIEVTSLKYCPFCGSDDIEVLEK